MVTDVSPEITLEALRSVPLFASLDDRATAVLRSLLKVRQLPAGSPIFKMGDAGDAMYLIEGGRVRISVYDADRNSVTLAELARGDFFGEMAILDDKPRSADASAIENARVLVLSRNDFHSFVRQVPNVALKMLSATTERLRRTDKLLRDRVSRNANEEEKDRIRADPDYQVNLKNELALTEVLRRLDVLESERLPILFKEQNAALMPSRREEATS